jgi:acarbose 7IV-phosphotransferase
MMHFLVSGLINLEATAKMDGFPIEYTAVRYPFGGISSTVAGVGYNISKALTTLGNSVDLLSIIGQDMVGQMVLQTFKDEKLNAKYIVQQVESTAQSVILYQADGKRMINTDLKDIQEQSYPEKLFKTALSKCDMAILCNINFSRGMLEHVKRTNKPIATDVHAICDLEDPYNKDFMAHATILFQSHERLSISPSEWIKAIQQCYNTPIVVVGMGAEGALMGVKADQKIVHVPSVFTRSIVNTIGAGDSLFSAFLHHYAHTYNPYLALQKAVVFASYKIGTTGAAQGFLTHDELEAWFSKTNPS